MNIAEEVEKLMFHCLYADDESQRDAIIVNGLVNSFGFHPGRVNEKREEIRTILNEMQAQFHVRTGGGWSFLRLPFDKHGQQWGEHRNAEALMSLGMAAGFVSYCLPRGMWSTLPGNMPYISINTEKQ